MPSPQMTHVDRVLSNIARKYKNAEYIGPEVMPWVKVQKLSDLYTIYDRGPWFTIPDSTVGPKSEAKMVDWTTSTGTYAIELHAIKDVVSPWDVANADSPISPEVDTTEFVTDRLLLEYEVAVATHLQTVGNFASYNTLSGTDQWDSGSVDATPVTDMWTAIRACVMRPNIAIIPQSVWDVLVEDATLIDKIKYTQPGVVTEDLVARVFGLEKVYVPKTYKTTDGGTTLTYVWGKDVTLLHRGRPSIKSIQYGCTFTPYDNGQFVRRYRDEKIGGGSVVIESWGGWDLKTIATDCGYVIKAAVA